MVSDTSENLSDCFKKYHLGCGPILAKGFLNIDGEFNDLSEELESGIPYQVDGMANTFILQYDLRDGIPAAPNSLEIIYHSHFLEHLTDREGRLLLERCYDCLQPNGLMRIAVPDFKLWCTHYLSNNRDFFQWYKRTYLGELNPRYETNCEIFMGMLYNWGHNMAYDFETLSKILKQVGFTNICEVTWGESDRMANVAAIEDANPRRFESLVVECVKSN